LFRAKQLLEKENEREKKGEEKRTMNMKERSMKRMKSAEKWLDNFNGFLNSKFNDFFKFKIVKILTDFLSSIILQEIIKQTIL
jgi:hypothetical protein